MAIPTRILLVLITVRLLMPPGICVCKLSSPAAYLLARALGGDPPAPDPSPDHHDDHHPGCPASCLSLGMGLQPPSPVLDPDTSLPAPVAEPPADCREPAYAPPPAHSLSLAGAPPLYVCHCALLI